MIRVCLIGDFSDNLDEGLKNIAWHMASELASLANIDLVTVNLRTLGPLRTLKTILENSPQIVHYIPGPTNASLAFLKTVKKLAGDDTRTITSCTHPRFNDLFVRCLRAKPNYAFSSSARLRERIDALGIPTSLLPNGVDLCKFAPADASTKLVLRKKYGVDESVFTVLHVGHLTRERNLGVLRKISEDCQVVVVGSQYINTGHDIARTLTDAGCIVLNEYLPSVEELYQLSDCYLFPVNPENTVACPLSVIEAMACNLRVITTRCEGLVTFFRQGEGLSYIERSDEIPILLHDMLKCESSVSTRGKVDEFSWTNIAETISDVYERIVNAKPGG